MIPDDNCTGSEDACGTQGWSIAYSDTYNLKGPHTFCWRTVDSKAVPAMVFGSGVPKWGVFGPFENGLAAAAKTEGVKASICYPRKLLRLADVRVVKHYFLARWSKT